MRIAITADLHLADKREYPERYNALENILIQVREAQIEELFIAGDLFDKEYRNYSEFEDLCKKHKDVRIHVIPGNHDTGIDNRAIVCSNVQIYTEPKVLELGSTQAALVPYIDESTMGDRIASFEDIVRGKDWILLSHGDYYAGTRELNPREPGTYMPLSRNNVSRFKPRFVFLGHIHKPMALDNVCYAGSPCGLDISETGKRTFILYDTDKHEVTTREVATDVIYFEESFIVVPVENECEILAGQIKERIDAWGIDKGRYPKVSIRVNAFGFAMDRRRILKILETGFSELKFYKDETPSIENLSTSTDQRLDAIAKRTMELIDKLDWSFDGDEPNIEMVKLEALQTIYSG